MFIQNLAHIRYNPLRAGLCEIPEDSHYSSARFYHHDTNDFEMLKHFFKIVNVVYTPAGRDQAEALQIAGFISEQVDFQRWRNLYTHRQNRKV